MYPGGQRQLRIERRGHHLGGTREFGGIAVSLMIRVDEVVQVPGRGTPVGASDAHHLPGRAQPDRPVADAVRVPAPAETRDPGAGDLHVFMRPAWEVAAVPGITPDVVQGVQVAKCDSPKIEAVGQQGLSNLIASHSEIL